MDASYGVSFLEMTSSVYPGFHSAGSAGTLAIGTIEGLIDGGISGLVLSLLYGAFAGVRAGPKASEEGRATADLGLLSPLLFAATKLISSFSRYRPEG